MTDISSFDLQHLKLIFFNNTMVSSDCHECAASPVTTENKIACSAKAKNKKKRA